MKISLIKTILCLAVVALEVCSSYASVSGSHSHGDRSAEKTLASPIIYKDSLFVIDACLEFYCFEDLAGDDKKNFLVKFKAKSYLKDSKNGKKIEPSKLFLRATISHNQFGEAIFFKPVSDDKMEAEMLVINKGEQHYLLIAEIEGVGVKEFHFHHIF